MSRTMMSSLFTGKRTTLVRLQARLLYATNEMTWPLVSAFESAHLLAYLAVLEIQ